jgi:hypothetical protein
MLPLGGISGQTQLTYPTPHFTPYPSPFYRFSPIIQQSPTSFTISSTLPTSLEISQALEGNSEEFKFYTAYPSTTEESLPPPSVDSSRIDHFPTSLFGDGSDQDQPISQTNKQSSHISFPTFPNSSTTSKTSFPTVVLTPTQTLIPPTTSSFNPQAIPPASSVMSLPRTISRSEKICRSRECIEFLESSSRREYCSKKCQNREQNSINIFFLFIFFVCYKLKRVECEKIKRK